MNALVVNPPANTKSLDAASVLTVWLVCLMLIPQKWVLPAGGAIARPAIALGLGCAVLYAASRMSSVTVPPGRNPAAFGLWAYGTAVIVTFAISQNRDLAQFEIRGSFREVLLTISMIGVAMLVGAGVRSRQRLEQLLERTVFLGAAMAVVALLQFYAGFDLVTEFDFPGLKLNNELQGLGTRAGFGRAKGTADHAIELGVVMAMLFPIGVHYALHQVDPRRAAKFWVAVALIAATIPTTLSRSGIISVVIAIGVLASLWSRKQLLRFGGVGFVILCGIYASSPQLLGSVNALFRNIDSDPSVEGRTSDYDIVFDTVNERPWFGRGPGTWGADTNVLLDNQILLSLIEIGWVGIIAFVAMFLVGAAAARSVGRRAPDDTTRHLGQALMAAILAGFVSMFFVDGMFFQIYTGMCFFLIGAAGALHRTMFRDRADPEIERAARERALLSRRHQSASRPRWWTIAVADDPRDLLEDING